MIACNEVVWGGRQVPYEYYPKTNRKLLKSLK